MMRILGSIALMLVVFAGCYGTKLLKEPINADLSAKRLDTLQTQQKMMLNTIERLNDELSAEREERMAASAESASRLAQIEEALDILSSKIDDSLQLIQQVRTRSSSATPPRIPGGESPPPGATASDSTRAVPPGEAEGDEETLFRSSSMDLTKGNYDLAMQGFKNYISRFPGGIHMGEAYYYLGECYYALEQYLEAAGEYQLVIKEYPQSRLIPAAYLKTGLCYAKMDEPSLAEKSFRELISLYPHTEEAEHARAALDDLGG